MQEARAGRGGSPATGKRACHTPSHGRLSGRQSSSKLGQFSEEQVALAITRQQIHTMKCHSFGAWPRAGTADVTSGHCGYGGSCDGNG